MLQYKEISNIQSLVWEKWSMMKRRRVVTTSTHCTRLMCVKMLLSCGVMFSIYQIAPHSTLRLVIGFRQRLRKEHFVLLTCCLHHMILYKQKEGGLTLDRRRYISSSATRLPRHARIPNPKGTEPNGCCLVLSSAPLSHRWGWKAWGLGKIFSS